MNKIEEKKMLKNGSKHRARTLFWRKKIKSNVISKEGHNKKITNYK